MHGDGSLCLPARDMTFWGVGLHAACVGAVCVQASACVELFARVRMSGGMCV